MALPAPAIAIVAVLAVAATGAIVVAVRRSAPPVADPPAVAAPSAAPAATTSAGTAAAEPAAPSLDVVRVTPEGSALVAGRAEPGATVTLRTEDGVVAETTADASGDFVVAFETTPSAEPRTLTLESRTGTGERVASADMVVLLPEAPPLSFEDPPGFAAAAGSDETPVDAPPGPATEPADAPAEGGPKPRVAATAVVRDGGVEVSPTDAAGGLTLASISYGEDGGEVTLAGIGAAGARIRAYVDDRFARDGAVGSDGRWVLALGEVATGVHRLRIDALHDDGTVAARLETPFQRDLPDLSPATPPGMVTVQPGGNLWTIARAHYGSGVLYTRIYTANRDLIRDPALIYPGQIFVLPEGETGE
ncbi:Ig-like domain-containing protein [Amaricoccus sp.]|uniref:Ig-like domain-containing protein n=1 Tax=Amaricoccus sp. TaxID=1872485 RepID=UPI001B659A69|nr:Ig-like domain-containing protein [Amaricoccus sp.]MBP7240457.1 LysM peptidoglycan-binding domain-containing protein [Amaricoccus sp.]